MRVMKDVLRESNQAAKAALTNEMLTRKRVELLEQTLEALFRRSFLGRLKWLLLGR